MKKRFSILFLSVTLSLMRMWGQTGATCADPLLFPLDSGCSVNESTASLEVWYAFTANSTDYDIYANNCGSPSTRLMERFYAYNGNCSALNLIAADSIVLSGDTVMKLQMSGLVVGNTYYLKLARSSNIIPCRTCIEPLATYNFCVIPVGARPSITIIEPSGSEWQCPYGHGACVPTFQPCTLQVCTGDAVGFETYSIPTATIPFQFFDNNAICDGSLATITWTFTGSNTAPIVDNITTVTQGQEILHSNIIWYTPGFYFVNIYFYSECTDCGQGAHAFGNYEWNIGIQVTGPDVTPTSSMVSCFGASDGVASVPNDPNLTYWWQPPGGPGSSSMTGLSPGTYSVTIFGDASGCQPIQTFTITEPPLLTVSTSMTPETCPAADDGTATATPSGGTPGYTYSWSTTPIQTAQTASGLNSGAQFVVVTDANGCTATGSIGVTSNPLPAAPIINTNNTTGNLCSGVTITYDIVQSYDANLNYTASYSVAPLSVTSPLTGVWIVTWPSSNNDVTFTLTVSNPNAPVCSTSVSVTIAACCTGSGPSIDNMDGTIAQNDIYDMAAMFPSHVTITNSGNVYTYSNPSGVLYLNSTFTVPAGKTLRIINSEVRFGGYAKIDVVGNGQLTVSNSHLYAGCNTMWDGMYVNSGGAIRVNTGSLVEDALNAVVSQNGGSYEIRDAIFNKNWIAVDVRAFANNHSGSIRNTVITCRNLPANVTLATTKGTQTAGFIQVYVVANNYSTATLLFPKLNKRSYAGFNITDVGTTILNNNQVASTTQISVGVGNTYALLNVFDNLDYGVYATRSNVVVDNNAFQYMTGSTTVTKAGNPETGIGVYGISDGQSGLERVMTVGNGVNGPRNTFYDCNRGIDVNAYYKVSIVKNRFQSNQVYQPIVSGVSTIGNYGIFVKTGRYINVDVLYNDVVNWNIGIAMFGDVVVNSPNQQIKFFGDAKINENRVSPTVTDFGTISSQGVRQAIIAQNIIPSCAPSCLNINSFGRLYINDNNLNNVFNGISVTRWLRRPQIASTNSNPLGQRIYLRYQTPLSFFLFPQAAIRTINCDAPVIYRNHIDGVSQNMTKRVCRGIYVTSSNSSDVKCNDIRNVGQCMVFEGTNASSSVFGNYMYDSQDGLVLLNNGKIGPQGSPPIPVLLPNGRSSDNQWIGPFSNAATYTMNTFAPNMHSPIYYRNNTLVEHPTGLLNETQPPGVPGFDDYNAPGAFVQVPQSAQGTNCNLPPALAQLNNGTPNQRVAMEQIVTDSISGDTAERWMRRQQVYFMLRKDSTWMNGSPILQQFYSTTQPSAIGIVDSVDIELAENNPNIAVSVNATMIPQTQIELNHQMVNDIYAELMTGDSSTISQRTTLAAIAEQCPLTGGNAVYRARTLLSLIEDEVLFYEDSCNVASASRIASPYTSSEPAAVQTNFELYPNPNNGVMTLNYVVEEGQTASFALFDMTGRAVTQFRLPSTQQTLTLDQTALSAGMYYYAYYVNGALMKSEKVIISK